MSNSTAPKYFLLVKMAEFQTEINDANQKLESGMLSFNEMADYSKLLVKLKDKISRFREKYDEILDRENSISKPVI